MDIKIFASSSSGNCYRVSDGKTAILLEAGIPIKQIQIACKFNLHALAGVFISHSHMDHAKACKDLMAKGIDVYTSKGTAEELKLEGHRLRCLNPLEKTKLGTLEIMPFIVEHDTKEPFGFWIYSTITKELLVFATDTFYLKYNFKGITHLMIECNYTEDEIDRSMINGTVSPERAKRVYKSHLSLETLLKYLNQLDKSKLQQIYLMHLSSDNSNEAEMRLEVQKSTGAQVIIC